MNKTDEQIVTGTKLFARDMRAQDVKHLPGLDGADWGTTTLRAMFLRTSLLGRLVTGIDAQAARAAGAIKCFVKKPTSNTREQSFEDTLGSGEATTFRDPADDYFISIGRSPRYVGQPVCVLLFDDVARYLDAQRERESLQSLVQYGAPTGDPVGAFESISLLEDSFRMFDQPNWPPKDTAQDKWTNRTFTRNGKIQVRGRFEADTADFLAQNQHRVQSLVTTTPAVDVAYLEPDSSLGRIVQRPDGKQLVELIVPTQSQFQDYLSLLVRNKVGQYEFELLPCRLGGGFGGRSSGPLPVYAALATVAGNGIPVRLEYDRIEQFVAGIKRHPSRMETNVVADANGALEAVEAKLIMDGGSVQNLSTSVLGLSTHSASGAYRCVRRAYRGIPVKNLGVLSGSMRGFGIPQALFNIEQQIDRIAAKLNKDPLTYRSDIVLQTGDRDIDEKVLSHPLKNKDVLLAAANTPHWQNRAARKQQFAATAGNSLRKLGTGLAFVMEAYGTSRDNPAAAIRVTSDLAIEADCFPVRMGQGTVPGIEQFIQQRFPGVTVRVNAGQGDFLGRALQGPGETRFQSVDTNAAAKGTFGTLHVLENLIEIWLTHVWGPLLADHWSLPDPLAINNIEFRADGTIGYEQQSPVPLDTIALAVTNSDRASVYGSAAFRNSWAYGEFQIDPTQPPEPRWLEGLAFGPTTPDLANITHIEATNVIDPTQPGVLAREDSPSRSLYASAACMVDVVVDSHGNIDLKKVTVVLDAGHRLNDRRVRKQVEGGIAQGIGHTLLETYPSGPLGGQRDINFDQYPLPRARHMPEEGIETVFVDIAEDEPVLGIVPNTLGIQPKLDPPKRLFKGIAEVSISPIAPAIANAIIEVNCRHPQFED